MKKSGILIPLFSVYSKNSFGVGDFGDLNLAVDWVRDTGNSILQFLPMNEMGLGFCPYDALSSFAIEPLYISLLNLPLPKDKSIKRQVDTLKSNLFQDKTYVNYMVKEEKMRLLWEIFLICQPINSFQFNVFKDENVYWLKDFCLYRVLKDLHQGKAWYDWEDKFKNRDKEALNYIEINNLEKIDFQMWVQWQLSIQLKSVKDYAYNNGVLLKGDLPILVSRDSSDVWAHPEFFKLEFASGAPPDMYCAKGQRWGMPTYNWENIIKDEFRYLREKLRFAENFYDILRIDHVVGLFRIWSIPYSDILENQGLHGIFDPADESKWGAHGRGILEFMQKNTKMSLCAEDLGVIPYVCTNTLKELRIPGNDVQRWVKDWQTRHDFLDPKYYRELSVSMLSTHDTTNWPAWWENEAGTVDEALIIRRCSDQRNIGFERIRDRLFDLERSLHGRLRWKEEIDSIDKLILVLDRKREEVGDFIDFYLNTFHEKEKLWLHLGLRGPMREKCDIEIMRAALKFNLATASVFCINTIFDWLYIEGLLPGDTYQYRINTPGTINDKNWSLKVPLSLEELLTHKVTQEIRSMVVASGRA